MKNDKFRSSSRRRTPWDDREKLSPLESFIRDEYKTHYVIHHPKLFETNEATLLNSYKPNDCPYCKSKIFKRNGFTSNGLQKYKCSSCNKTFVITTNTIFDNHKISVSEWIEYLLNLFGYSSLNLNSKTNKNSSTTAKYWLIKVFLVLKDYQDDIILSNNVQIDETYYSVINSKIKTKNGKKLRGISKNKYCIAIGCDNNKKVYLTLEGKGKPTINKTKKAFINHIQKNSTLIHDDEHSHSVIVKDLNLSSKVYSSKKLNSLKDEDNPLKQINHYCFLLKEFLNSHSGFKRQELQGYLNLFSFMMNKPFNKLEKVNNLLELSILTHKKIKYRDYYSKKANK